MEKTFDGKKRAKLGTAKNPASVHVQTEKRLQEVETAFKENDWRYTIELKPDEPEDTADLELLLNPVKPRSADAKIGRNDPCPCGSGKKYKKCCEK